MARAPKTLTPAEVKTQLKDLNASLKALKGSKKLAAQKDAENGKAYKAATAEAQKVLDAARKVYEAAVKAATKDRDAFIKTRDKEAAQLDKQIAAHEAKIAELSAPAAEAAPV